MLAACAGSDPQPESNPAFFLIRHAEVAPDGTRDPPLSAAGLTRAECYGRELAARGIERIWTTDYRRTGTTAEIIGDALDLPVEEYDPDDLPGFAAQLQRDSVTVLVVGHSNTTPALVQALGADPGAPIPETEYGRFYAVTEGEAAIHREFCDP